MRICVFGAGAVGGLIAARLARSGADVSVCARGETLAAIRGQGLTVRDRSGEWSVRPRACGSPEELGVHDVVIAATKAHALSAAAASLSRLLGPDTVVASAVNGIPWWYFHGLPAGPSGPHLESVDPGGVIWREIGPQRALGCVVHLGAKSPRPGEIEHAYGLQLVLGEPSRESTPRLAALGEALSAAGFKVRLSADIRAEAWTKLFYNVAINPVSVVTGAACDRIAAEPALDDLMAGMIEEATQVASALGTSARVDAREAVKGFAAVGAFKTSMLQDFEARRPIELSPILGAVVELAGRTGVAVPRLQAMQGLARARTGAA